MEAARSPLASELQCSQFFLLCGYPHSRNNWLFAGRLRAGQRAVAVMSLIHPARGPSPFPQAAEDVYSHVWCG